MEIRLWRELLIPYELAVKDLVMKFKLLKKEHREKNLYSPIEQVTGRVKSINSILEKMQDKHVSWDELEEKIEDIAGVRIICQFCEDIEKVASLIRNRSDMKVLEEKFRTIRNGKGVAFAVPLSSVIGVNMYRFLSNNR